MDHGERCIINDPAIDMVDPTMSMAEYHIRSAMCVPILYRDEILGVIYGDRVRTSTTYQQDDVDFLAGLARQLSVGLVNARLLAEHEEKLHLENEIALARRIQTDLYPHEPLDTETVYVTGTNRPGRQVSGDYFDVVPLDDGRIAVVMADVVGKGVAAALLTANLQAAVRVTLPLGLTLPEMVERWNRLIHANTDVTKFITALIGILDPARNRFEYVAAGHFPPFLIEPGGAVRELPVERGLPLGIDPTEIYVAKTAEIPPRAMLFLYTDGVTEALCTDDTLYGSDRFVAVLQRHAGAEPAALVAAVEQSVADFVGDAPQSDDITLMVIQNK
jgi:serine phosphatase RsbU (regulator of sigma subunit)